MCGLPMCDRNRMITAQGEKGERINGVYGFYRYRKVHHPHLLRRIYTLLSKTKSPSTFKVLGHFLYKLVFKALERRRNASAAADELICTLITKGHYRAVAEQSAELDSVADLLS